MPYKDPIKANLQKQRWSEMHPEYGKAFRSACEKSNKRWLTKKRRDYMRAWRKSNASKMLAYSIRNRHNNHVAVQERKRAHYLKNRKWFQKKAKHYHATHKNDPLYIQKRHLYAISIRYEQKCYSRKRYYKSLESNRKRNRDYQREYYRKNVNKLRAEAIDKSSRRRVSCLSTADRKENVAAFIWKVKNDPGVTCSYCRKPIYGHVHMDHIIPLTRLGRHTITNLCPACETCNISKGYKTLSEWEETKRQEVKL